jgi:hypothetical protein
MRGKQGSHVGMILSFVIFITFIVFIYTVVQPAIKIGTDKKAILDDLRMRIESNISANFTSAGVQIVGAKNPSKNCIRFTGFLSFLSIPFPYPLIVKNETGGAQLANYSGADLEVNRVNYQGVVTGVTVTDGGSGYTSAPGVTIDNPGHGGDRAHATATISNLFYKVYYSLRFNGLPVNTIPDNQLSSNCPSVSDYNVSSVKTDYYVFEKGIFELLDNYKKDYGGIKNSFKVPPGNEFGLIFTNSTGGKTAIGNSTSSGDVYAEEIPIQYVNSNATILSGFINIEVW